MHLCKRRLGFFHRAKKWRWKIFDFFEKYLDKRGRRCYTIMRSRNIAELCNGSTTDSDSVCWGSNPYSAAKIKDTIHRMVSFVFCSDDVRDSNAVKKCSGGAFLNGDRRILQSISYDFSICFAKFKNESLFGSQRKRVSHSGCPFCFVEIERDLNRVAERNLAPSAAAETESLSNHTKSIPCGMLFLYSSVSIFHFRDLPRK